MRAVTACCLLLVGCSKDTSKPTYPEPKTEYQGRTADGWGKQVLDANEKTREHAIEALGSLKGEGVPYLLTGAETFKDSSDPGDFLIAIKGNLVHPADLGRVAAFLKPAPGMARARHIAVRILGQAGPAARPYLPQIKPMLDDSDFRKDAEEAIASIEK